MLGGHLRRGAAAGVAAGVGYGLYVAYVGNPLVTAAEAYEPGGPDAAATVAPAVGISAGLVWGLALGVLVFGVAYALLEPALPGTGGTKSYLLAAAGFLVASGVPWLALPPQPPGVDPALATQPRIAIYAAGMLVAAVTLGLAGYAYGRLRPRGLAVATLGAAVPFALVGAYALLAPPNPVAGPVPPALAVGFRGAVVFGQLWLWGLLAAVHAWLLGRVGPAPPDPGPRG